MLRTYTREEYLEKIAMIREARRPISVTSDIIVGFPGETEEDLEETLSLLDAAQYDGVFAFQYSPRPNTTAQHMPDAIPEEEKGRRLARVMDRQREIQRARNEALVGETFEVLVDGASRRRGPVVGSLFQQPHFKFHFAAGEPSGRICSGAGFERQPEQPCRRARDLIFGRAASRTPRSASGRSSMEVEMKIRGLMMDPVTNMPIVVLKDAQGTAVLPIWVGIYEANAIALEIEKVQTPRPMTHDLLRNVFLGLDVRVQKVVVNDLKDDTFYALIWVERNGEIFSIDSRPSDALALALRVDCPIFVEDEVLKSSKISSAISEKSTSEELRKWLEGLSDEDLGRYKM